MRKNSFWKQIDLTKIVIALISAASLVLMGEKATGTEHTYDCPTIINEAISQQQAHPQLKLIYGGEENVPGEPLPGQHRYSVNPNLKEGA